jgi:hypothetical protein
MISQGRNPGKFQITGKSEHNTKIEQQSMATVNMSLAYAEREAGVPGQFGSWSGAQNGPLQARGRRALVVGTGAVSPRNAFHGHAKQAANGIVHVAPDPLDDTGGIRDLPKNAKRLGGTSLDWHRVLAHRHDAPHPR